MDTQNRNSERGNVFFAIFAAIGMVGILGAATMTFIRGPLVSAVSITRQSTAEQHLQMAVRLAAMTSATQPSGGDCDGDGFIEPLPYVDAGALPHPAGGGFVPPNMGAARRDPWGRDYGYCAFDHGAVTNAAGCGGVGQSRQVGGNSKSWEVIAVMSAGKDGVFQTTCNDWTDTNADLVPDTALVLKPAGSDDIVMTWTYAEATAGAGGLWQLEPSDSTTAEIDRNLSVKDGGGAEKLSFDTASAALAVGAGGSGSFPNVKADYLDSLTNPKIEFLTTINATADIQANGTTIIDAATGKIVNGEQDPKIGTVAAGKWCKTDGAGKVSCDQDVPNPAAIGTIQAGKWCQGAAGGVINCTTLAPTYTEGDPQVGTVTNGKWCTGDASGVVNCTSDAPTGGGGMTCTTVYEGGGFGVDNAAATCPATYTAVGGGCTTLSGSITESYPSATRVWACRASTSSTTVTAYAVCCK